MSAPTRHNFHNSRWKAVGLALSSLILLAGCSGESNTDAPADGSDSSSRTSTRTSTTSTTSTSATTAPAAKAEVRESATPSGAGPAAVGPTLVECIYGGGAWTDNGWMSDGSYGYHPQCAALRNEQLARYPYVCPQTDHHVADLSECAYPTGIPIPPAAQAPSAVDEPAESEESVEPPIEPGASTETGTDPCESDDTSAVCQK